MAVILLVVGDKNALTVGDAFVRNRLIGLGHTVTLRSDEEAEIATGFDGIFAVDSCSSGTLGSKYATVAKPAITTEFPAWGLGTNGNLGSTTTWTVAAGTALSAALSGSQVVHPAATFQDGTTVGTAGAGAVVVATHGAGSTIAPVVYWEGGSAMATLTAPARRVLFRVSDAAMPLLATAGLAMLDAAIVWAFGVPFLPQALGPSARISVEVAWGADLAAAEGTWVWTDITADVRQDPGISTSMGRNDEASTTQPATCTMTLDNTTAAYSLGPQSPNYPLVRRNTPVRVRVDPGDGTFRVVFLGYSVGFTPSWTLRGNVRDVSLTAAGTLRRLIQGASPVLSPIRRALLERTDTVAYWPCEDGKNATAIAAGQVLDNPMTFKGAPAFAGNDDFACSAPLPVLKRSTWTGSVSAYLPTLAVQVRALVGFPTSDQTTGSVLLRIYTTGSAARWDVIYEAGFGGLISMTVYDRFGTQIADTAGVDFNVNEPPLSRRWSVEMVQNGANIDWRFSTLAADATTAGYFAPPAVAGHTVGAATSIIVNPDGLLDDVAVGHVTVQNAQTSIYDDLFELTGYEREFSSTRFLRLCDENGVTRAVIGDGTPISEVVNRMGSQPLGTLVELLRETETNAQGLLLDGLTAGLTLYTNRAAENLAATLTVAAASAKLAGPFGPVDDDQRTRNRVEAKQASGSDAVFEDATGPLGTAAIGTYDTSITVNCYYPEALRLFAGWLVGLGTVEGYRYPTLTVDLRATPELAVAWLGLRPGRRVDVTGLDTVLPGHPPGVLSLLVEGVSNEISAAGWTGTLRCSPYASWRIGVAATDTGDVGEYVGRADTDGSTLSAAVAAGATSISVTTISGPLWTTTADDMPYDLEIGGRQVTVTACVDGTSPQVMTIAAAPAALALGAPVRLWNPTRTGL